MNRFAPRAARSGPATRPRRSRRGRHRARGGSRVSHSSTVPWRPRHQRFVEAPFGQVVATSRFRSERVQRRRFDQPHRCQASAARTCNRLLLRRQRKRRCTRRGQGVHAQPVAGLADDETGVTLASRASRSAASATPTTLRQRSGSAGEDGDARQEATSAGSGWPAAGPRSGRAVAPRRDPERSKRGSLPSPSPRARLQASGQPSVSSCSAPRTRSTRRPRRPHEFGRLVELERAAGPGRRRCRRRR